MAFAEEGSPAFFAGAFDVVQATYLDEPKVAEAFRTGKGVGFARTFEVPVLRGTERFASGPATTPTLSQAGFPRSAASKRSSRPAPGWPMSDAATAPRPS